MLDDKLNYRKLCQRYSRMPIHQLQKELGEIYKKRFVEHDIEYAEVYRVAARVYNTRTRDGSGLIFHLKNFVPFLITFCSIFRF
jgi:hypothetical protein